MGRSLGSSLSRSLSTSSGILTASGNPPTVKSSCGFLTSRRKVSFVNSSGVIMGQSPESSFSATKPSILTGLLAELKGGA